MPDAFVVVASEKRQVLPLVRLEKRQRLPFETRN